MDIINKISNNQIYVKYILIALIVLIIILISYYFIHLSRYTTTKCNDINSIYTDMGSVSSLTTSDLKDWLFRDFYIKTAYNACALGEFKNTYVDQCALKQVIRQGVRCLDFEIYSINERPVIAVSSIDDYNFKQSYNYLDLYEVLQTVNNYAFSGSTCPNPNDPLILHFRIKTNNTKTLITMSNIIAQTIKSKVLDKKYSYEYNGNNLGSVPIKNLLGKIIIIANKSNPHIEDSPLNEYVNICSNSAFMRELRNFDVKYTPNMNELVEFNKKCMTISMPDLSNSDDNVPADIHMKYGVQMIGMCYQNYDNNLEFYESFFAENKRAFVLKPASLRYTQPTIPTPTPQDPKLSYANRDIKSDYYSFTI